MSGAITGAITGGMQGAASFMKSSKLMGSLDEASHFSKKVKAPKGCPKDCFAAGTMVKTEQGYKAIEEIEIGDKVWSWDEESGEQALKTVVQLFRNTKTVKTKVRIESEDGTIDEIVSTPRHKYYLPLNRANRNPKEELEHTSYEGLTEQWVSARDLKAGDRVVLAQTEGLTEGVKYGIVKAVKTEESESYTTYNLEVEDYIPIFWGKTSVCVHNAGCGFNSKTVAGPENGGRFKNVRIDVEMNPAGKVDIHMQAQNLPKMHYKDGTFPTAPNKLANSEFAKKGIQKAIKYIISKGWKMP